MYQDSIGERVSSDFEERRQRLLVSVGSDARQQEYQMKCDESKREPRQSGHVCKCRDMGIEVLWNSIDIANQLNESHFELPVFSVRIRSWIRLHTALRFKRVCECGFIRTAMMLPRWDCREMWIGSSDACGEAVHEA